MDFDSTTMMKRPAVPYLNPYQIVVTRRRTPRRPYGYIIWASVVVVSFVILSLVTEMGVMSGDEEAEDADIPYTNGIPRQRVVSDSDTFQLVQKKCKIPLAHKWSLEYNVSRGKKLDPLLERCYNSEVAMLVNNVLYLKDNVGRNCCVREISRSFMDPRDSYKRSKECVKFMKGKLDVSNMEFMEVVCDEFKKGTWMANPKMHREFHAHVSTKAHELRRKLKYWDEEIKPYFRSSSSRPLPPSVFVLVVDSTSRTEAYRSLPKTMNFLVNKLGFIDFKGHHPMGEPSLINALALLMGSNVSEISKFRGSKDQLWDSVPFIWDEFEKLNYVTGFLEDLPRVGTFNWASRRGFSKAPTDLYLRPLMLAHEAAFPLKNTQCFGKRRMLEFFLDYQLRAMRKLHNIPTFLISWPAWPWVQIENSLHLEDPIFYKFFEAISMEHFLLENSWLIVTSDHGYFKGTYANTHEGLIERRSIPLLLRPPNRAKRTQPEILDLLLQNSERITGHFDVYRTFLQIAKNNDKDALVEGNENHGQSLLTRLRVNRTCKEAEIHWLMCGCNLPIPKKNIVANKTRLIPYRVYPTELTNF